VRGRLTAMALAFLLFPLLSWANPVAETGTPAPAAPPAASAALSGAALAAIKAAIGTDDVTSFLAAMDADRLLLFEVRKDLPQVRSEADTYMKRLKELAALSDPVHLVPKVNRMMEQAPIYFDYVEKNIQNQNDAANEYVVGGARGFIVAFQDFQGAVLLTAINRLEIAERAIRSAAGISPS
jgi:alkylation response protein AidB-like acyl-CoA dehydrogenase